jgi:hypothetical protein
MQTKVSLIYYLGYFFLWFGEYNTESLSVAQSFLSETRKG